MQDDRLQDAGGDAEIDRFPRFVLADGGVELDFDGEFAAAVEHRDEAVLLHADPPLRMGVEFGERDGAGEQVERAAFGILHLDGGGQGEHRLVAAEIANEFEAVEPDRRCGRIRR